MCGSRGTYSAAVLAGQAQGLGGFAVLKASGAGGFCSCKKKGGYTAPRRSIGQVFKWRNKAVFFNCQGDSSVSLVKGNYKLPFMRTQLAKRIKNMNRSATPNSVRIVVHKRYRVVNVNVVFPANRANHIIALVHGNIM